MAPPKKQLRIRGKMTSLRGRVYDHLSRVWTHASFSEQIVPVICPSPESRCGSSFTSPSSWRSIVSLLGGRFRNGSYSKNLNLSMKRIMFRAIFGPILAISVRFQIDAAREFSLVNSENFASVAESGRDILGCPNLMLPPPPIGWTLIVE
jgi:hypothetical protein